VAKELNMPNRLRSGIIPSATRTAVRFGLPAVLLSVLLVLHLQAETVSRRSTPTPQPAESAGLPRIGLSETVLYFEAERFMELPPVQVITIFNTQDIGVLHWDLDVDRGWLSASPATGQQNEANISVWIIGSFQVLGQHTGHIIVGSNNAVNAPETVWVHLNMLCPIELTGDVNDDGQINQTDIIYLVNHLLRGGPQPLPLVEAGDVLCDGDLDLGDVIYLVNFILKAGPSPCNACALI
jgi:hypothetical protein